ncbi:MAG: flavin reductase family protein [Flavobacteriaceae bacterium]
MQFDPNLLEQSAIYKLLTGLIIPRPIGWISSVDADGVVNLAPFSYFNAVGDDPPHVMFSTSRSNHVVKDTLRNVLETKQFVVNMVTEELAEAMNLTAHPIPSDESEFDYAHLTSAASVKVMPPRVLESPVAMECELVHHYTLEGSLNGGSTIIIGRVVQFHINDELLLDEYKINLENYQPVARLAGSNYAKLGEIFTIKRN